MGESPRNHAIHLGLRPIRMLLREIGAQHVARKSPHSVRNRESFRRRLAAQDIGHEVVDDFDLVERRHTVFISDAGAPWKRRPPKCRSGVQLYPSHSRNSGFFVYCAGTEMYMSASVTPA